MNTSYVNPINRMRNFEKLANDMQYVDKTDIIFEIEEHIESPKNELVISRPRRFGKTSIMDMLVAYYGVGGDEFSKYFKQSPSTRYHCICVNMSKLCNNPTLEGLLDLEADIIDEVLDVFTDIQVLRDKNYNLGELLEKTSEKYIIFIDEWDRPLNISGISNLFKEKYIIFIDSISKSLVNKSLIMMFGIYPVSKLVNDSFANSFYDFSVFNDFKFNRFFGFTECEVEDLLSRNKSSLEMSDIKLWYNGYCVKGTEIYNPNSIIKAICSNELDSYWDNTGSSQVVKDFVNYIDLDNELNLLISGSKISFDFKKYTPSISIKGESRFGYIELLSDLIVCGFLTACDNEIWIPNNEIKSVFYRTIFNSTSDITKSKINTSRQALEVTLSNDTDTLSYIVKEYHDKYSNVFNYNKENTLTCVLNLVYFTAEDDFYVYLEQPTGEGRADMIMIAKDRSVGLIVEFKVNHTPDVALKQILNRKYYKMCMDCRKVLLVGITYDAKTKIHKSQILETDKQKLEDHNRKSIMKDKTDVFKITSAFKE